MTCDIYSYPTMKDIGNYLKMKSIPKWGQYKYTMAHWNWSWLAMQIVKVYLWLAFLWGFGSWFTYVRNQTTERFSLSFQTVVSSCLNLVFISDRALGPGDEQFFFFRSLIFGFHWYLHKLEEKQYKKLPSLKICHFSFPFESWGRNQQNSINTPPLATEVHLAAHADAFYMIIREPSCRTLCYSLIKTI